MKTQDDIGQHVEDRFVRTKDERDVERMSGETFLSGQVVHMEELARL